MGDRPTEVWDLTDPANPQANIWPECPTCDTAWIWRRGLSMSKGWIWLWASGCKHKAQPVLMTHDGPYKNEGDSEGDDRG